MNARKPTLSMLAASVVALLPVLAHAQDADAARPDGRASLTVDVGDVTRTVHVLALDAVHPDDVSQSVTCHGRCTLTVPIGRVSVSTGGLDEGDVVIVGRGGARLDLAPRRHVWIPSDRLSDEPRRPSYVASGVLFGVAVAASVAGGYLWIDGEVTHEAAVRTCAVIEFIESASAGHVEPCDSSAGTNEIGPGIALMSIGALSGIAGAVTTALTHHNALRPSRPHIDAAVSHDSAMVRLSVRF